MKLEISYSCADRSLFIWHSSEGACLSQTLQIHTPVMNTRHKNGHKVWWSTHIADTQSAGHRRNTDWQVTGRYWNRLLKHHSTRRTKCRAVSCHRKTPPNSNIKLLASLHRTLCNRRQYLSCQAKRKGVVLSYIYMMREILRECNRHLYLTFCYGIHV